MIFLLNMERVLLEVLELGRLRIAKEVGVSPEKVQVSLVREGKELVPVFQLEKEIAGALEKEYAEKVISGMWGQLQPELRHRWQGLREVRYGCGQPEKSEDQKAADS